MASADQGERSSSPNARILALTSGLGCSVMVILLAFIGGGIYLDRRLDTVPIWTVVGVVIALTLVGFQLWMIVRISREKAAQVPWPRSSVPGAYDDDDDWGRPPAGPDSRPT